jgi:hypothetical protein
MEPSDAMTQRVYARVAGFAYLWLIVTGIASMVTISRITGSGTFLERARNVAVSERLYRVALSCGLIETLSAVLLAFALYVTLKPVDKLLAQMAMFWRLGESFTGGVGVVFGFVVLHLYTAPQAGAGAVVSQALVGLTREGSFVAGNISAIFFGVGSILFSYLFYKSRYIPRALAALSLVASLIVPIVCFGTLIFPEHAGALQYGWAPMALAEVGIGFWLMVLAVPADAAGLAR